MKETSLFKSWWFQNNYPLSASSELEEKAKKVWEAAKTNAVILLRIERTKPLNIFEQAIVEKCIKVLEDNL